MKKLKKFIKIGVTLLTITLTYACVGTTIPENAGNLHYFSTSKGIYAIDFYIPGGRFFPYSSLEGVPRDFKLQPYIYYNTAITYKDNLYLFFQHGIVILNSNQVTYYSDPSNSGISYKYKVSNGVAVGIPANYNPYSKKVSIHIVDPAHGINTNFSVDSVPELVKTINDKLILITENKVYILNLSGNSLSGYSFPVPTENPAPPLQPATLDDEGNLIALGWKQTNDIVFVSLNEDTINLSMTKIPEPLTAITGCNNYLIASSSDYLYFINYEMGRYEKKSLIISKPLALYCEFPVVFADTTYYVYAYSITTGVHLGGQYCYKNCHKISSDDNVYFVGARKIVIFSKTSKTFRSTTTDSEIKAWILKGQNFYYVTDNKAGYLDENYRINEINLSSEFEKIFTLSSTDIGVFMLLIDRKDGTFQLVKSDLTIKEYQGLFNNKIVGE